MNYNCEGLINKQYNTDFVDYITKFDLICLTETHMTSEDFDKEEFPNHEVYISDGTKIPGTHGRLSGGVIVLIKSNINKYFQVLKCNTKNCVAVKVKKELLINMEDTVIIGCYLPPQDSPYWKISTDGYGLEILEKCMLDIYETIGEFKFLIIGNLNARTSSLNMLNLDCDEELQQDNAMQTDFPRQSDRG